MQWCTCAVRCCSVSVADGLTLFALDKQQRTVFHYAARGGNGSILRALSAAATEQDAPLTIYTDSDAAGRSLRLLDVVSTHLCVAEEMTPLMLAATNDNLDAVSALLTIGVDPRTALASAQGSSKMYACDKVSFSAVTDGGAAVGFLSAQHACRTLRRHCDRNGRNNPLLRAARSHRWYVLVKFTFDAQALFSVLRYFGMLSFHMPLACCL